jgi:hypothetical protein
MFKCTFAVGTRRDEDEGEGERDRKREGGKKERI